MKPRRLLLLAKAREIKGQKFYTQSISKRVVKPFSVYFTKVTKGFISGIRSFESHSIALCLRTYREMHELRGLGAFGKFFWLLR